MKYCASFLLIFISFILYGQSDSIRQAVHGKTIIYYHYYPGTQIVKSRVKDWVHYKQRRFGHDARGMRTRSKALITGYSENGKIQSKSRVNGYRNNKRSKTLTKKKGMGCKRQKKQRYT